MTESAGVGTTDVHLVGVQAATVRFAREQHDAMLRELELLTLGAAPDDASRTEMAELRSDLAELRLILATFRPVLARQLAAAEQGRDGPDHVEGSVSHGIHDGIHDLVLPMSADLAERADEGNELFDRLESRCGGRLLLPPPPALARGFRTWFFEQIVSQLLGGMAVAWPTWWTANGDGSALDPHRTDAFERSEAQRAGHPLEGDDGSVALRS